MARSWNTKHVILVIAYVILIAGLTFQYMLSRKWMHASSLLTTTLKFKTGNLLRASGPSSDNDHQNITPSSYSTTVTKPSPDSGTINWSGINSTAVDDLRKKISTYVNGKLSLIVYKQKTPLKAMKFYTNITKLEMANLTDYLPHQRTCAVLGNSGILLNSSCGHEIDSHDLVIRANLAPTLGFERDVGHRTSIMMFNRASTFVLKKAMKKVDRVESQMIRNFNNTIAWYPLASNGSGTSIMKYVSSISGNNFRIAYSIQSPMHLSRRLFRIRLPTTGLNMFSAMNYFCDKISLYGFFPFYEDKYGRPLKHHYFSTVKYNYTAGSHKMPVEFLKLQQLSESGILRLVTDRCSDVGHR